MESGNPITPLTILGVRVNISRPTISQFFNGPNFHPLVNTSEIDYRMDKIQKITKKQLGSEDKMRHFWSIASMIAVNREDVV